ncbi:MAG: F-box domain protein [Barrevirus sp.]|uniref:F-box domain protein n=1 Tax=Barrevirus sp. TaxID=2487763 RepID=A0A3G4ZPK3_9VIRU|nr:MAG: F-box domain protein [Barrevirus sp.]
MDTLSGDIIGTLFEYLSTKELILSSRVNKKFRKAFKDNIWKYKIVLWRWSDKIRDNHLIYLKGVKHIDLSMCKKITASGLASITEDGGLISICLGDCNLTDEHLEKLKGIPIIDLWLNNNITEKGFAHLKGVKSIRLTNCYIITDSCLMYLTGVHTISLFNCHRITDFGLSYLRGVQSINLSHCPEITDTGLSYLVGVKVIDISHCINITDIGLSYLAGVNQITLYSCGPYITNNGLNLLRIANPNVKIISIKFDIYK